jgi:hypothetical protein
MTFTPRFYKFAAVCSVLSAVTTSLLIFLPSFFAPGEGFEARMNRVNDPAYELRSWAYLMHPFLVVTAALAVAMRQRATHASVVIPGLLAFTVWGATEAAQQTMTLFAFDRWREAWLAGDEAVRATMQVRTAIYDDFWNAMYFLILLGFFIGCALYAVALWKGGRLARVVSVLYICAAALTFTLVTSELGAPPLLPSFIAEWAYPAIQPLARVLIGVWLWRNAVEPVASISGALSSRPSAGHS